MPIVSTCEFKTNDQIAQYKNAILNFQKLVKNKPAMLAAITDFAIVSGEHLEPELCGHIDNSVLMTIITDVIKIILYSDPKINGNTNNWSVGFLGSCWMDVDAKKYGLDYVRIAFYSKSTSTKWTRDKPILLRITAEVGK